MQYSSVLWERCEKTTSATKGYDIAYKQQDDEAFDGS